MSAANDNSAKSVFALLKPALQKLTEEEASPERQDTLGSMEAINVIARKHPEQEP